MADNDEHLRYERLRPSQIWEALQAFPVVYVPDGPIEWHGRHLPVGTDFIKAQALLLQVARQTGGLVFPPVTLGASTVKWPLSMSVDESLVQTLALTVMRYLASVGARVIVWLSGHGGTEDYLAYRRAAYEVMEAADCLIYAASLNHVVLDHPRAGGHAGAAETSFMHHLTPDLVDVGELDPDPAVAPQGVAGGDPRTQASAKLGEELTELASGRLVGLARRLAALRDPVARRRHRECVRQQVVVDELVAFGRAHMARADAPPKLPLPIWRTHLLAFLEGDYETAMSAGTETIDAARAMVRGSGPAPAP